MSGLSDLHAVVVSSDRAVLDALSICLKELSIEATCQPTPDSAIEILRTQKTDAFFVDQELDPELSVLEEMRASSSSRAAIGFAIVPWTVDGIRACRAANFVLGKPLSKADLTRALRMAYGMMLQERRRYSRHTLRCEAILSDKTGRKCLVRTTNISQTGMALECAVSLSAGEILDLQFRLPHDPALCTFQGRVIWTDANGKAGLTFIQMSAADRKRLAEWIDAEFLRQWHPVLPESMEEQLTYASH